jgi:hypothetical protein
MILRIEVHYSTATVAAEVQHYVNGMLDRTQHGFTTISGALACAETQALNEYSPCEVLTCVDGVYV